uniref:SPX domain-containing protein n=1 Tax=Pseudo-nitzschia australis TaxID=44445 RepID=A0A6U9W537_9STRA|mmetsp:Transcript_17901/g.36863  ORF Transcript_17901/g.36863 Transcript_17901/m.36863 type:complete len:416 (+) Transcript_17901:171-1418(+)|eukprot:CAMPEP_0168169834 /NCGR_PEP_ID=MMETSP0139_2-20121125/3849_1 /TAXON_ID=44445 /ORGANISM="Pseudo-nitzschia australis, Strain 10249 10 AB" /LENGTH=415 /DNA_ID=CAMNT_0008087279 /DNA_START=117 /DNA_END=1364 /DNA_ORIENTATION=-
MKFGKTLAENLLKEWRFYYVGYKDLKKCINEAKNESLSKEETKAVFDEKLELSEQKLSKFYHDKLTWATGYIPTLEKRVADLRESASLPGSPSSMSSSGSVTSDELDSMTNASPTGIADNFQIRFEKLTINNDDRDLDGAFLKEAYRQMGGSKHFQDFIYAKKSLVTFKRELDLLLEFLEINTTAFSKILKKFDKKTGSSLRQDKFEEILERNAFLEGGDLIKMKRTVEDLIEEVTSLKPRLPSGWENRKVYTIGCFDLFHRGHQNVLLSLREFGAYLIVGIHDDESYFKLKNKYTIENLETRMNNVKPFADQIYVIPSTDPLVYIKNMVSDQDITNGSCCYARGDDMLNFPSREWVESVMPVHFVPRTEGCSSTLIRTIYHADNRELRQQAAFAKTRYDGKPIDENGNVLKLKA